jgi:hypothetical protein
MLRDKHHRACERNGPAQQFAKFVQSHGLAPSMRASMIRRIDPVRVWQSSSAA